MHKETILKSLLVDISLLESSLIPPPLAYIGHVKDVFQEYHRVEVWMGCNAAGGSFCCCHFVSYTCDLMATNALRNIIHYASISTLTPAKNKTKQKYF